MKRLKKINDKEYNYKNDLNWRDDGNDSPDGQCVEDPSMNDFIKGYQMDPYDFRQWAKNKKGIIRKAWNEVDVIQYTPEYLADKILKLWNSADGLLQNFYESFTLRYNNKLKIAIAEELKKNGYTVYPLLIDDKPIYAKHKKLLKKIMADKTSKSIKAYINFAIKNNNKFKKSIAIKKLMAEVNQYENNENKDISLIDFDTLAEYYKLIYPKDYAISLVKGITVKDERSVNKNLFDHYEDFSISNESLSAIEKYLSGNQDPISYNDGGAYGYDFNSNLRNDTTMPNNYEVESSKKKD